MIKVALVDDHVLLRNGLASVINSFGGYEVVLEADNGKQFIELLRKYAMPELVLLDITMPEMDGFATSRWIKENAPAIKILVLSMMDDDTAIIQMLKNGAKGYILKDSKPVILKNAMQDIMTKGFYFNELVTGRLVHLISHKNDDGSELLSLSDKETDFLKLCCTEKSYKQIADAMHIPSRAVEALRASLFEKLQAETRIGLVMYALKKGLVKI